MQVGDNSKLVTGTFVHGSANVLLENSDPVKLPVNARPNKAVSSRLASPCLAGYQHEILDPLSPETPNASRHVVCINTWPSKSLITAPTNTLPHPHSNHFETHDL